VLWYLAPVASVPKEDIPAKQLRILHIEYPPTKTPGTLPEIFVLHQALMILTDRCLIVAAQTSLESDSQCDSLGPA
jgi:hypothetical protein